MGYTKRSGSSSKTTPGKDDKASRTSLQVKVALKLHVNRLTVAANHGHAHGCARQFNRAVTHDFLRLVMDFHFFPGVAVFLESVAMGQAILVNGVRIDSCSFLSPAFCLN